MTPFPRPLVTLLGTALAVIALGLAALAPAAIPPALAREKLPWQAEVAVDQVTVHSDADPSSPAVGPLTRGQIVSALREQPGADGQTWMAIGNGFVPADTLKERDGFWIAEVAWPTANVHAEPNAGSDVRRIAHEGDLLRVAGISPGLDGDGGVWWATTEGYVPLGGLRQASGEWADNWKLPDPSEAPNGFWVEITSQASVRAGPTMNAPEVGTLAPGERVKVLAEEQDPDGDPVPWYRIDGGRYAGARIYSSRAERLPEPHANTTPPSEGASGRWIVVDRQASTLTVVKDGQPEFVTYVSLGRAGVETPAGPHQTVNKLNFDDMSSAQNPTADRSYDMPNVPDVLYFTSAGDAIHGTYWHDRFGSPASQGCVNLTLTDGAYVFGMVDSSTPVMIVG